MTCTGRVTASVIGAPIDVVTWDAALARVTAWACSRESRYVCICNSHSVVTASQDEEFGRVVRNADMATADGAPVAWMLRRLGFSDQARINGPDLMWRYCRIAEHEGVPIYFYGSADRTLAMLRKSLIESFPLLKIAGMLSPPFRALSTQEDDAVVREINESGARVVFVSLGCPKQEKWMAAQRGCIQAVMIGVGAAFDYHAGVLRRAPLWMQRNGLEWLHRLITEPRRLWKRYLVTNTLFLIGAARQLLSRFGRS
jgi:N-acetylglucosaminyldiphosphoundecaprenol N-acetyl-beta-D-mannosaminyltransferase